MTKAIACFTLLPLHELQLIMNGVPLPLFLLPLVNSHLVDCSGAKDRFFPVLKDLFEGPLLLGNRGKVGVFLFFLLQRIPLLCRRLLHIVGVTVLLLGGRDKILVPLVGRFFIRPEGRICHLTGVEAHVFYDYT